MNDHTTSNRDATFDVSGLLVDGAMVFSWPMGAREMIVRLAIALTALLVPSAASAAWHLAESKHFVVYSDDEADDLKEYAEQLERFDAAVRLTVRLPDRPVSPSNRVTVFLVDDLRDLRKLANVDSNSGVAGFYEGRASGSYAFAPRRTDGRGKFDLDPRSVLQHEYAHHLMLANYTGVFPAWVVEGWAEFFATTRTERDGDVTVGAPPLYRAYGLVMGKPLKLSDMVSGSYDKLRDDQMDALYGRGWALTHYLMFESVKGGARAGQLDAYLKALSSGRTGQQAAVSAFGDLKQLDRELDQDLRQSRTSAFRFKPAMLEVEPVSVRALRPGEAAIMDVRMRSKRGVDGESAPKVLADARQVAAKFQDDPFVLTTLAEAEYDAGHLPESLAAADRAVALDPRAGEAMIYQSRARMAMLLQSGGDAAAWAEARKPLLAANAIENDDAEPLMLYYGSYVLAGERPTRNAVAALMMSQSLAPQDVGLRMTAARQLLEDGEGKAARAMIAPVAFSPHAGGLAEVGRAIVDRLDSEGAAAALALMDQKKEEIDKEAEDPPE